MSAFAPSVARRASWLWPTTRVALSPAALATLAVAVVPVALLRLVVTSSAEVPGAVGTVVALAFAAATAAMLADDAAFTLAPVAESPARRALQRALIATVVVGTALLATAAITKVAWPDGDVVDIAACISLAVTAGVVTAVARPTGSHDGAAAAMAGTLAAMALAITPLVVGGLGPVGRWLDTATSVWSTDPWLWALGMVAVATVVLHRR